MSAVEQAREGLRAAYHAWWRDQTPISVVLAAEEKLIAAVRAEEGKRWREGVEKGTVAEGGHLPECAKGTQGARYCDCGAWGALHANNAALAALAARMEAK